VTAVGSAAIWFPAQPSAASHPALDADLNVEVVVVGAGLMGLTAALELARAGVQVVVLERRTVGAGETSHTTAHVTARPDAPMRDLLKSLGKDKAAQYWAAMGNALDHIVARSEQLRVPFRRVEAWLFGRDLKPELEALLEVGASAYIGEAPNTFRFKQGLAVRNQARFDVGEYLRALTLHAEQLGVRIFENSAVTGGDNDTLHVQSPIGEFAVRAERTVLATHVPLFTNPVLLDRLQADQSYAIAVAVPAGSAPDVLAEDDEDPYHYYRLERGARRGHAAEDIVVFGGNDHATGSPPKEDPYRALETRLREWLPGTPMRVLREWTGELWTVADGLPIIAEDGAHRFYGTGFAGVGMTQATLAGTMAAEWAKGREVPWASLFTDARFSGSELPGIARRGAAFVTGLVKNVLPRKLPDADSLAPGEGEIVQTDTGKRAAYRTLEGTLLTLDPHCTHAGCEVVWNGVDRTWDCPCHGSRFYASGEVRAGPAVKPLAPLE
jgi:glycine/D-amino acid oxidase-like deaminating enzyme/nitrite reductase/ring-hydroxylating ferredoxin subunit